MSCYPKGKEPECPLKHPGCSGIIHSRDGKSCYPCSMFAQKKADNRTGLSTTERGNERDVTYLGIENPRTLEDLIRVCEIDLDTWEVKSWTANKWEMGYTDRKKAAHSRPLYQVKALLVRKAIVIATREEIASLLADAKSSINEYRVPPTPAIIHREGFMLEPSIPDLHVGKLAWGRETGHANYDTRIAQRIYEEATATLAARVAGFKFEKIILPIGNDLLNSDSMLNQTTGGTPQDTDARFQRSFGKVRLMITLAIEFWRKFAPVHVVMVPGNHDQLSVWHLGDSLDCYFHGYSDVDIDNAPRLRKYAQFEKVMLMFTHGNKGKHADYPNVMAVEEPEMWADTIYREAHVGHTHKTSTEEYHGVRVRTSPALCPPDAWHAENQFVGNKRSAEAFVWHGEEGLVTTAFYTVPHGEKD